MSEQLLPCKYCGNKPEQEVRTRSFGIFLPNYEYYCAHCRCKASQDDAQIKYDRAIQEWNEKQK